MRRKIVFTLLLMLVGPCLYAAAQELDAATLARIAKSEAGPATIDVSAYPKGAQEDYAVFFQKCSQCHKLSRAINSDYALPGDWERYVKRMMHKPGSGITSDIGKRIFTFVVYDSSARKKEIVDQKMTQLSSEERKAAEDKIKEVKEGYGVK